MAYHPLLKDTLYLFYIYLFTEHCSSQQSMNEKERAKITDLSKCDFKKMFTYFVGKNEERKNKTKEEKRALKEKNEDLVKSNGWCIIDGHKQRVGEW